MMSVSNTEESIRNLKIEPAFFSSIELELMPEMVDGSATHWVGLEEIVRQDSVRRASVMKFATDFLDRILPLTGASHADVRRYTIEIPTRYARCFAELTDGRKVSFRKLRKFVGWSDRGHNRSLLFHDNGLHIEIQTEHNRLGERRIPGRISDVILEAANTTRRKGDRKFIGIDGSRIFLPA